MSNTEGEGLSIAGCQLERKLSSGFSSRLKSFQVPLMIIGFASWNPPPHTPVLGNSTRNAKHVSTNKAAENTYTNPVPCSKIVEAVCTLHSAELKTGR